MTDRERPKSFPPITIWIGGLLAVCIVLLLFLRHSNEPDNKPAAGKQTAHPASSASPTLPNFVRHAAKVAPSDPASAEAVLHRKMTQFSQKQRDIVESLAQKHNVAVPDSVKRFFDAVDAGDWDQAQAIYKTLHYPQSLSTPGSEDLRPFWRPIQDTWGAVMMAQKMPAQEYLDYGNAVLGSLKPGTVYVGGTDPGMFIPNMLNATSDGDQHIVLTQNALADSSYLDYLSTLYGGQLKMLTTDQSAQAFQDYLQDAQKRLQHDQQFPDEPKQLLPGEDVKMDNGRVAVSGQVAVMAINENLFQMLMQNNPDVTFAIEQSWSFKSTYAGATPLGPIMQLGAPGSSSGFSSDTAQQAVTYWQNTTQQLLANPEAAGSSDTLLTYSHDAVTQAEMLAAHNFSAEAEQAYNLASQLAPTNFEPIAGLTTVLYQNGKSDQAIQVLNDFAQRNPNQQAAVDRQRTTLTAIKK
jgi:hypothetical protein